MLPYDVSISPPPAGRGGIAFLLAQLGSHAAEQFALALAKHDLTPPLVGILRILRFEPGLSQQALAERLGMVPSRIVAYVDDLEDRRWVARTRDPGDRRVNVLTVTEAGQDAFASIAEIARDHEAWVSAGLATDDRASLLALLTKLSELRGLTPGVHPGYRHLR
jgi:DNA-binding MarR family transcriptional regulator